MRRALHLLIPIALLSFCAVALGSNSKTSGASDFRCRGAIATLVGTPGNDRLVGTPRDDVIVARAGNDVVRARGGDDKVCDNGGTDHVILGAGDDEAGGGPGSDHLDGGSGDDSLAGRNGNDTITGGAGADRLIGEVGNDTLRGNAGPDNLSGGLGADDCLGGPGLDRISTCEKGDMRATPRDRPPLVTDDTESTSEVAAKDLNVLANDSDPDGDPLRVASVDTTGTTGAVSITGGGTGVRYDPGNHFASLAPGQSATDRFTYMLTGGTAPATVRVSVVGIDTAPSASGDGRTVNEGAPPQLIDVLANDTDPDGGPMTISLATDPANGTVVLTGGSPGAHTGLTYQPDPAYCNSPSFGPTDNFTYTLTGGSNATVAVSVTCVNDAPVVTTTVGNTSATEDAAAATVDSGVTVTDGDDTNIESATVRVSSGFQSGDDLVFVNQNGISAPLASGGVLTLTGTASKADYETALRSVKFRTTNNRPNSSKAVEFKVNDGFAGSNTPTKGITVTGVNDAPTLNTSAGAISYGEGAPPVVVDTGITATDPDSDQLQGATVSITSNFVSTEDVLHVTDQNGISGLYSSGTGVLTLTGDASPADYRAALATVTYENTSQNPSNATRTLSFRVTDTGVAASNVATRNVTVGAVNDAPVVATTGGSTAYNEGDPATAIDGALTVTDVDDTNLESAQVRISSSFESGDDLVFVDQNGISGDYNIGTGVLTLTGTATKADYRTALRSIKYRHTGDNPASVRTVEFKVNDGSADSDAATKGIAITAVNSPPQIEAGGPLAYTENDPATAVSPGLTLSEPEGNAVTGASASVTSGFQPEDALAWVDNDGAGGINLDASSTSQTIVLTGTSSAANYQGALRTVTYVNSGEAPSDVSRTVTFSATDDQGTPSSTGSDTLTINFTSVDDPPVAVDDSATVPRDASATSIDVLANDTDVDGGPMTISLATDPANGIVVLTGGSPGAHTGLTYEPDPAYCNDAPPAPADTFSYTINGGSIATVSIAIACVD